MRAGSLARKVSAWLLTLVAGFVLLVFFTWGGYALAHVDTCGLGGTVQAFSDAFSQSGGTNEIKASARILRREGALALVATPDGEWWVPDSSVDALYYDQAEQRREIYGRVRQGDVVLDCGANVGLYTREALRQGARLVVSIEPSPDNIECLRRNFRAETASGKVIVYPKGVWHREDVLPLHISARNQAGNSFVRPLPGGGTAMNLPLTTVDNLVSELRLSRVDFIKMDIEGAERNAVAGARATLQRYRPRMALCVYHLPDDPQAVPAAVNKAVSGYRSKCACLSTGLQAVPQVLHLEADRPAGTS